jgi:predicted ATPase
VTGFKAETHFEGALVLARVQRAKSWELRAAMSMATLWRKQGNRRRPLDLVAPLYSDFTEGLDTIDLVQVKALLDARASDSPRMRRTESNESLLFQFCISL